MKLIASTPRGASRRARGLAARQSSAATSSANCRCIPATTSRKAAGFSSGNQADKRRSAVKWTDAEDIAIALVEKYPNLDPLTVRFTDLRAHVLDLPDFDDDPKTSNEPKLEAIQMAWHEEFKDQQG